MPCTRAISVVAVVVACCAPLASAALTEKDLDALSRRELVDLVLRLQRGEPSVPDGVCAAGGCADAGVDAIGIVAGGGPNDAFDDYDKVYPGLWSAAPDAAHELEGLTELSLPSAEKDRLKKEHHKMWADALERQKSLNAEEQAESDLGFERNGFNQWVSDRIPLRRRAIDTRAPHCIKEKYPALRHMPSTSVIVVFYNEAQSTLLRTAWSIVDRTPPSLLKEVILVDDGSSFDHLKPDQLDAEVAKIPKTRVLRLPERVGLIRAKVRGVEVSTGDVVAFMDSHCEVNDGWLEPLLAEIVRNPRAVALPLVDPTHYDTFSIGQAIAEIGTFSWSLEFQWMSPPVTKTDKERQITEPFFAPIMCGGLFAMGREFFFASGAYDENMDTWGGENFEMSFRLWMCGGEIITVPCSRIAHVFRKKSPYTFKNRNPFHTISHNLNRVAAVWMDHHQQVYQLVGRRFDAVPESGDISERVALRRRLRCKSFEWYMKHIGSIFGAFTPDVSNIAAAGLLRNEHTGHCLYHEGNPDGDKILAVMRSCDGHSVGHHEGPEAFHWYFTQPRAVDGGEIRHVASYGSRCVFAHEIKKDARVSLVRCYDHETGDGSLLWRYNTTSGQISLVNFPTGCLTASSTAPDQVIVSRCKGGLRQRWAFLPRKGLPSQNPLDNNTFTEKDVQGTE